MSLNPVPDPPIRLGRRDDASDGMHPCQFERRRDEMAAVEQYLVRCTCHDGSRVHIWRHGDGVYRCPVTGAAEPSRAF